MLLILKERLSVNGNDAKAVTMNCAVYSESRLMEFLDNAIKRSI